MRHEANLGNSTNLVLWYYYLRFFFYRKLLKGKFKYAKTQTTLYHSISKCLSSYCIKAINQVNTSYVKRPLLFTDLETSPSFICSALEVSIQTQNRLTEIHFFLSVGFHLFY